MKRNVAQITMKTTAGDIAKLLKENNHGAYPVVNANASFKGTITRCHLERAVAAAFAFDDSSHSLEENANLKEVRALSAKLFNNETDDIPRYMISPVSSKTNEKNPLHSADELEEAASRPGGTNIDGKPYILDYSDLEEVGTITLKSLDEFVNAILSSVTARTKTIDLSAYTNTSAFTIVDSFSIERAFLLFRTMGLRHLVVLGDSHQAIGILTRHEMMGHHIETSLHDHAHHSNHDEILEIDVEEEDIKLQKRHLSAI
jgi:predicted transcriptional regulator